METKAKLIEKVIKVAKEKYEDNKNLSDFIELLPKLPMKAIKSYYNMITGIEVSDFSPSGMIIRTHIWETSDLGFEYWYNLDKKLNIE